ncbi:hypothetical protein N2152v2_000410 [Parachlorella kessleri]
MAATQLSVNLPELGDLDDFLGGLDSGPIILDSGLSWLKDDNDPANLGLLSPAMIGAIPGNFNPIAVPSVNFESAAVAPVAPQPVGAARSTLPAIAAATSDHVEDAAVSKAAAQKERIKAKNRRAQTKYREKQKNKMKDTEAQVEEMGIELERLRMENARMQHAHAVMEKVLEVRDMSVGFLEATREEPLPTAAAAPPAGAAPGLPAARPAPIIIEPYDSAGSGHSGITSSQGGSPAASSLASGSLNGSGGLPGSGTLSDTCVFSEGGVCSTDPLMQQRRERALRDAERMRNMGPEEVQAHWRNIVQRLRDVLAASSHLASDGAAAGEGAGVAVERAINGVLEEHVRPILSEASMLCFEHAIHSPTNMQLLLAKALDDGRSGQKAEDMQKWAAVAAALQMRPEQREQVAAFREVYLRRMCRILQERKEIFARLGELNVPDGLQALRNTTELWLKTHEATQDLEQNIHEEHVVSMDFLGAVMGRTLDVVQRAVSIVESWPFFPDCYSIATAAVAGHGHLMLEECCSS